jgi:DNA-3-methyladenine glycosylase
MSAQPLSRRFYARDVAVVARDLLGRFLWRESADGVTSGRIVEVEAYLPEGDTACHAFRGPTRRNATMFGPPGRAYVYAIHSRWCLNAVTEPEGSACAVLIRAVEPAAGVELMRARRRREALLELARGPARLCEAFAIDRALDGWDLTRGEQLWIARGPRSRLAGEQVAVSPRIGVTSAHDLLLRYYLAGNRFVSGRRNPKPESSKPRAGELQPQPATRRGKVNE